MAETVQALSTSPPAAHGGGSSRADAKGKGWPTQTATKSSKISTKLLLYGRLRLTGDLLDLVDHHEGIRQAHLHRVVHRADLRHLDRDLKQRNKQIDFLTSIAECLFKTKNLRVDSSRLRKSGFRFKLLNLKSLKNETECLILVFMLLV